MSNTEASKDSNEKAPVSRQSMKRSRRTQASQPKTARLKAGQPAPSAAARQLTHPASKKPTPSS